MYSAGAAPGAEVFGEPLVVEAIHGPILVEGLDQVEGRLVDHPGDVGLRIGLIVRAHRGVRCVTRSRSKGVRTSDRCWRSVATSAGSSTRGVRARVRAANWAIRKL